MNCVKLSGDYVVAVKSGRMLSDGWLEVVPAGMETGTQMGALFQLGNMGVLSRAMVDDETGHLIERPASAAPVTSATGVSIPAVPNGTTIVVDDGTDIIATYTADIDDYTVDISLPNAGVYAVEVAEPLPATKTIRRFVVETDD